MNLHKGDGESDCGNEHYRQKPNLDVIGFCQVGVNSVIYTSANAQNDHLSYGNRADDGVFSLYVLWYLKTHIVLKIFIF